MILPSVHAFPIECEQALAYLIALRDRLKAAIQKQRDDDYVRRTPTADNPRARRGANWELFWILNTPLGNDTTEGNQSMGRTNGATEAGTGAPWWLGGK